MLTCLINQRRSEQFRRIELAHGEPVEPGLAPAGVAVQARPAAIPLPDINTVRPALAEEDHGHETGVYGEAKKKQRTRSSCPFLLHARREHTPVVSFAPDRELVRAARNGTKIERCSNRRDEVLNLTGRMRRRS